MSWSIVELGDLAEFRNGINYNQNNFGTGIKVIGVVNFQNYIKPRYNELEEVNPEGVVKDEDILQDNDILFVRSNGNKNLIGRSLFIESPPEPVTFSGFCIRTRFTSNQVFPRFFAYLFRSDLIRQTLSAYGGGTNIANLNQKILSRLQVPLPPLPTQQRIAEILSTYDRLIDNNNHRIALLEESIHLLYKEWFVHLRFPGYESVKVVDGIPQGWNLKKLEELGLLGRGKSKHRPRNDPSLYGGEFPFIQTGEVKEASLYITNYSQTYNEKGLTQSKLWNAGTLLITIAANIAETAILTFSACFPDSVVGFIADSNQVSAEFIKYSIDTIKVRMRNVSTGAAQDNLSLEKIRIFDFLVPDKETMQLFTRITNPIFLQIKNLLITNENLRQARDLLLPRLINGSIAV
jgi:type I restriction enzyme S subunit